MSKTYTQRTAALRATKINTRLVDAQKLLIYPGDGDKNDRIDVAEVLADHSEKINENESSIGNVTTAVNELKERNYAYTDAENTFLNPNTFNEQVTVNSNVLISNGELTFEDLVDGTVIESNGATGYRYVTGIPANFNNGICYDIGEITNETDLSIKTFNSTTDELVQTCELWFTTSATPPTTHKWPNNIYWIDSATGAAPTLLASKNYRLVFRREPNNKIIASIAYIY